MAGLSDSLLQVQEQSWKTFRKIIKFNQKICMTEEGNYGTERLKGNTQEEEDGGPRNRSLNTNHARSPCYLSRVVMGSVVKDRADVIYIGFSF